MRPRSNIELKARIDSVSVVQKLVTRMPTTRLEDEHQVDTYFHCPHGRLKLREINGNRATLISYERPDTVTAKQSTYQLVPIDEPVLLKSALAQTLGIRAVVDKVRQIFLFKNVRIHLDKVRGLGEFLEFEAVLDENHTAAEGQKLVRYLMEALAVTKMDLLTGSYGEMIAAKTQR